MRLTFIPQSSKLFVSSQPSPIFDALIQKQIDSLQEELDSLPFPKQAHHCANKEEIQIQKELSLERTTLTLQILDLKKKLKRCIDAIGTTPNANN